MENPAPTEEEIASIPTKRLSYFETPEEEEIHNERRLKAHLELVNNGYKPSIHNQALYKKHNLRARIITLKRWRLSNKQDKKAGLVGPKEFAGLEFKSKNIHVMEWAV